MLDIKHKQPIEPIGGEFDKEPSPEAMAFLDHVAALLAEEFVKIMKEEGIKE